MAAAFQYETVFVRSCAKTYASEIGFSPRAEEVMIPLKLSWPEIHQALRNGRVVWSDKEDADVGKSTMIGKTCDGDTLRLTIIWDFGFCHILVANIERL